ncbi:MAG: TrkH family potassium uptake protein [Deltaproteobacteria bacterium]|nr:TrkH family potassium uptake protein [Deltaproteobacteria bacterium]
MLRQVRHHLFILNYLGSLLLIFGLLFILPLVVQLMYHEHYPAYHLLTAFLLPGGCLVAVGFILQRSVPHRVPTIKEGMLITALAWLAATAVSALPYIVGLNKPVIDALFEAASGITATGMTVFTGLDRLPRCMLFWRSLTQWLGGIGILTFFLVVSFRGGSTAANLFGAEGNKITTRRPVPGILNTVKIIWSIYLVFSGSCFLLLWLAGMTPFDALNHTLTAVSTGGFSTHDASIAYFSGRPTASLLEYILVFFMLMGGINFLIHFKLVTGDWRAIYQDFEIRWFWGLLIGTTLLIIVDHLCHAPGGRLAAGQHLHLDPGELHQLGRQTLFQVSAILTSTGYTVKDINSPFFPPMAKQLFILLMFVGGCAGSTAGGFKVLRLGILWQVLVAELQRSISPPRRVLPIVIQGHIIDPREIRRVTALLCAWLLLIMVGTAVGNFFSDLNNWQSFSGMLSAVSNMGPAYFTVDKLASLHPVIKLNYIFGMLVGRLEILPFFVLFSRQVWR